MTDPNARSIRETALANAAAELMNGSCPLHDIASAGQPREAEFRRLAEVGYRTVIDLRHPSEPRGFDEAAAVHKAGLRYQILPVTPQTLGDADFDQFRALLRDPSNRPALVHCASANRVGAMLLAYLLLDEKRPPQEAIAIAREAGLRSQELADVALRYARKHGITV